MVVCPLFVKCHQYSTRGLAPKWLSALSLKKATEFNKTIFVKKVVCIVDEMSPIQQDNMK